MPKSRASTTSGAIVALGLLAVVGVALTITFGVLYGDAKSKIPPTVRSFQTADGCRYSSQTLVDLKGRIERFRQTSTGFGGDLSEAIFGGGWDFFRPDFPNLPTIYYYTTEEDAVANYPLYREAYELSNLTAQAKADPTIGDFEFLNINFIQPEIDVFLNLTRINHNHGGFGSCLLDTAWNCHPLEWNTLILLFAPGFASEPDYGPKMNLWLQQYKTIMPGWVSYIEQEVASPNPHPHALISVDEWAATWGFFLAPGENAAYICDPMTNAAEKTTCMSLAADVDALNEAYLTIWNGAYRTLASTLRPNNLPGLNQLDKGEEAYRYWIRYHTETDLTPTQIRAEGAANVAQTITNLNNAMGRLDPPQTFEHFVNRSNDCTDPDFFFQGGNISCPENSIGDRACHKEALDKYWAVLGQTSTFAHDVNGYLARNAYAQQTDGTGLTYIFGGGYDSERSMYISPATINWGGFDCPATGKKAFDRVSSVTTMIHEFLPGHGAQLGLESEIACKVTNYTSSTAWFEGFGLWTESLGFEMGVTPSTPLGLYQDPIAEAGRWSADLLRTVRLVVDSDLHAFGSSYQDCVDAFTANGLGSDFGESECRRYINMPAQALAYWLGKNQFVAEIENVKAQLGSQFDVAEYMLLVTKFGGFFVYSDIARFMDTYVKWKLQDPAARDGFGYDLLVNNLYLQAAPVVAKHGLDIRSRTEVPAPPASKRMYFPYGMHARHSGEKRHSTRMSHEIAMKKIHPPVRKIRIG